MIPAMASAPPTPPPTPPAIAAVCDLPVGVGVGVSVVVVLGDTMLVGPGSSLAPGVTSPEVEVKGVVGVNGTLTVVSPSLGLTAGVTTSVTVLVVPIV
jgi:predicted acyltransferase (DUF342 family)